MTVSIIRQETYTKGYIGQQDDTKPTNQQGSLVEGVNNGDTFYEVDTAKTFIFYEGDWYDMQDGTKDTA